MKYEILYLTSEIWAIRERPDSNRQPSAWQADALTIELRPHWPNYTKKTPKNQFLKNFLRKITKNSAGVIILKLANFFTSFW